MDEAMDENEDRMMISIQFFWAWRHGAIGHPESHWVCAARSREAASKASSQVEAQARGRVEWDRGFSQGFEVGKQAEQDELGRWFPEAAHRGAEPPEAEGIDGAERAAARAGRGQGPAGCCPTVLVLGTCTPMLLVQ